MTTELTHTDLDSLLHVAETAMRLAVLERFAWHPHLDDYPATLQEPGAAFVTLRIDGRLRGCIGSLAASQPLVACVADRARAAALADPRFTPVEPSEVPAIVVEVSVLGDSTPMQVASYDDLLRTVRPGVDGVTVEAGPLRATLLPSVWDEIPEPERFIGALWRKAGLRVREWPHDIRVLRYGAQHWPA